MGIMEFGNYHTIYMDYNQLNKISYTVSIDYALLQVF